MRAANHVRTTVKAIAIILAVLVALFLVDRLALWMERRGWIYWRRSKASPRALGNAFLQVQSLLEADKQALLEVRQDEHAEEGESGDHPDPGATDTDDSGR